MEEQEEARRGLPAKLIQCPSLNLKPNLRLPRHPEKVNPLCDKAGSGSGSMRLPRRSTQPGQTDVVANDMDGMLTLRRKRRILPLFLQPGGGGVTSLFGSGGGSSSSTSKAAMTEAAATAAVCDNTALPAAVAVVSEGEDQFGSPAWPTAQRAHTASLHSTAGRSTRSASASIHVPLPQQQQQQQSLAGHQHDAEQQQSYATATAQGHVSAGATLPRRHTHNSRSRKNDKPTPDVTALLQPALAEVGEVLVAKHGFANNPAANQGDLRFGKGVLQRWWEKTQVLPWVYVETCVVF